MYYVRLNLWTKVKLKINQHIQACQTPLTPPREFIMQKGLQHMKFTGLDTECSLLSKPSPAFRDVSSTKQRSRTEPEPAQTSLIFTAQELISGWLLRGLWALMGPRTDCGWSWWLSVCPHPWAGSQGQPSLPLFQSVQDRPWIQFCCSTSSTHMASLTQKSMEKSETHGRAASLKERISSYVSSVWKGSCFPHLAFAQLLRALLSNLNIMLLKLVFFNWGRWNIISVELQITLEHNILNKLPTNTAERAQSLSPFTPTNKNDVQYTGELFSTEIPGITCTERCLELCGMLEVYSEATTPKISQVTVFMQGWTWWSWKSLPTLRIPRPLKVLSLQQELQSGFAVVPENSCCLLGSHVRESNCTATGSDFCWTRVNKSPDQAYKASWFMNKYRKYNF